MQLLVCVAESRNFNAKKLLVAAMKVNAHGIGVPFRRLISGLFCQVGAVTGSIGQINTKSISYDRLTAAIRLSEECLQDDPRPTSTLK